MSTDTTTHDMPLAPSEETREPCALAPAAPLAKAAARRRSRGMSLIEIMVVMAIISMILGGIGVVAFNQFKKAQLDNAKNETVRIKQAVEQYMLQKRGKCPKSLQDLKAAGIVDKISKDPWGNDFEIKCPGEKTSVDVISPGPDGELGTPDDIANYHDEVGEDEDRDR